MIVNAIKDEKYFDWRSRRKRYKDYSVIMEYGGRNLGKTTKVFFTEFQDLISQYKSHRDEKLIQPIISLVRTQKTWQKIKSDYLNNLTQPPFNLNFKIDGTNIYWVEEEEKTHKNGEVELKIKKRFLLCKVIFLWSANDYKQGSLERYKRMIFDEMIPEGEDYIPSEIKKFNQLVSTFCRLKSGKQIVGICNKITNYCPYLSNYGIDPDNFIPEGKALLDTERGFVFEHLETPEYIANKIKAGSVGAIQSGSDYEQFSLGKKIMTNENYQIISKPKGEYYPAYNVWIDGEAFTVNQYSKTAYWITEDFNPYVKHYYLDSQSALKNNALDKFYSPENLVNNFTSKLNKNRLWFKNPEIREKFLDFFKKFY